MLDIICCGCGDHPRTPGSEVVKILAEATFGPGAVLRCFPDRVASTAADLRLCLRLLGIGLPLAIGLGMVLAFIVSEVSGIWRALAIGAALAPTDAGLGAGMMDNRAVQGQDPAADQRRDWLTDEIATPFVLVGLLIGAAVGGGGGWLVTMARGRGWVAEGFAGRNRAFDGGLGVKGRSWSPPLLTTP